MRTVHITDSTARASENDVYIEYNGTNIRELIKVANRMLPDRIVINLTRENAIKLEMEVAK